MHVLYDDATDYWGSVFQMLFVSYLGISLSYIYGTLLTAHESIKMMNHILLAGVFLNLLLNFFFIKAWQSWGAALATVITQSLTAIALTVLAHRRLNIKSTAGHWLPILAFSIVVYAMAWWSSHWSLPLLLCWAIVGVVGLVAAGLLRMLNPNELRGLSDLTE
jgi:Na+-driven multidrug efflux pump